MKSRELMRLVTAARAKYHAPMAEQVKLGHVFGQPGLVVDTHVRRVARRLGLTRETDPEKIERDLQALLEPTEWTPFSMRLILHGRTVCGARRPRCEVCELAADCPRIGVAQMSRSGKT